MNTKEKIEIAISIISAIGTIVGVVGAIVTIRFGFNQINMTIKEQKAANRLELADDLMSEYISLSSYASKAAFYLVADANNDSEALIKMDSNYPNYIQKHAEALENIKGKIAAYGSEKLVELFYDSYNFVQLNQENGKQDFESNKKYFYSMPLIASYLKYDLTGEIVNPSTFYNCFMREIKLLEKANGMENFHKKMISTNDELVRKYHLSERFIWKEIESE